MTINLNFSDIYDKKCEYNQDMSKSDYETWSITEKCRFGAKVKLTN